MKWRRYSIPMLVLLLALGIGAYLLQSGSSARDNGDQAFVPRRAAPAGAAPGAAGTVLDTGTTAAYKTLPNGVRIGQSLKNDTSPPLRDIPPAAYLPSSGEAAENPDPLPAPDQPVKDTVVQRSFGALVMPTPIITFDGLARPNNFCNCLPPDTNGDVGPNHYVQTVNSGLQVWNKSGTSLLGPIAINTLWSGFGTPCQTRNDGDPITLYDQLADRWFVSQFTSAAPYGMCIAVSQTADPTGAWHRYWFQLSTVDFYDYEKYGVWPDGYYMSANVFEGSGGFHPSATVFDRTSMLTGAAATYQEFNAGPYYGSLLPADHDGSAAPPAGAPNYFASTTGTNDRIRVWKFHVDWANPANSTFTGPANILVAPFDSNLCGGARNCIPQPGTAARVDSLNNRLMFRLAYRNMGGHEVLMSNQSVDENGQDHAGVRWYELRKPTGATGNFSLYQQGTYAPDAAHRWMGSMAMDRDGNIAVGYSAASSTLFPSIRYAGRLASDPLGQLAQGEASLIEGTGSQTSASGRWGDYSSMSVDPSDDCTFWYTQEYYSTTSGANWRTRIGAFKFPSCGGPTPTGTPPTATPVPPSATPVPPTPPACGVYTFATATAVIVPGTNRIDGPGCDDCAVAITLPFAVPIYGQWFTSANVSSNGVLEFASADFAFSNGCLPVPVYDYSLIPYWDDLYSACAGCGIYADTTGAAPNRVHTIQWRVALCCNATVEAIFEVRLHETPLAGNVYFEYAYGQVAAGGAGVTVGVQRDAATAQQFSCNTASLSPGLLISFIAPPPCLLTPTPAPPTVTPTRTPQSATATATPCTIQFTDVDQNNPFYSFIRCLACRLIVSGYSDGTFRWGNDVTRGQLSKIISGAAGQTNAIPSSQQTFEDVPNSNTFWVFIERLSGVGAISGYACGGPGEPCGPGNRPYFRWGNNATRGQISKITAVTAGWNGPIPTTQQTFTDVPPSNPFWVWIEELATRQIISGYTCGGPGEPCDPQNRAYFRWGNNATRGQMSKIAASAFFPNCQTPARR